VIIGAGGAARAAAFALARERPNKMTILNRTPEKAAELACSVRSKYGTMAEGRGIVFPQSADILVKAVPGDIPVPKGFIRKAMTVMDMAYGPGELIRMAETAGAVAIPGTEMLLHQGAAQFWLFTGHEAPLDVMRAALGGTA
jgi:shikimate dehydrogenase